MGFLSETHPDLYNEWDFKENSGKGIDFYKVTDRSGLRASWRNFGDGSYS